MMKNCETPSDLEAKILACQICKTHLPLAPRPILQWSSLARILVVGQAPGRKAHETGLPFNDASGDRLRAWMGVKCDIFYNPGLIALVPMGFCYPGTGPSGDLPPRLECAAAWRKNLMGHMPHIDLTLLLGDYAQRWHRPDLVSLSLSERTARWRDYFPATVLLPHPSPRNTGWLKQRPWVEHDIVPALQYRIKAILKAI